MMKWLKAVPWAPALVYPPPPRGKPVHGDASLLGCLRHNVPGENR